MTNSIMINRKKRVKYLIIILIWLIVWELVSIMLGNSILLVGPAEVISTLMKKVITLSFWSSIGTSFLRIASGFLTGAFLGVILGIASYKWRTAEEFLMPLMAFLKAVPVASFVVLFLIWWHSDVLSVAICVCVVLPQIYVSIVQGLKNTNVELLEMAKVMGMHPLDKMHYIYRPAVRPYLEGALKIAASLSWKSGVAAEVIGTPDSTIGEALYMSKIYLDTSGVLAWTVVIILISVLSEKALLYIFDLYNLWIPKCYATHELLDKYEREKSAEIVLQNICKSYDGIKALEDFSARYTCGDNVCYDWPSGKGKTTLLKILAGLEKDFDGEILGLDNRRVSMLFQEDRLCEDYSAIINVAMTCGNDKVAKKLLLKLLDLEDIYRPVKELSGGQKRRVALARALGRNADIYLFDEPYNGLDADNREKVKLLIEDITKGKICVIASHIDA